MNKKKSKELDVRLMAQLALLTSIMLVMAFTPLGYIPLPFMNATTMHIPVIVGACILGPKAGGILGGIFGVTSVIKATIQPNITSFVFTPFHGSFSSFIVAILPRILIGVAAGWIFACLKKRFKNESLALIISGFAGSMVNTVGVMTLIFLFFGDQYAAAGGVEASMLLGVILGVIGMNGIPEALIAAIITQAAGKALLAVFKKSGIKVTYA